MLRDSLKGPGRVLMGALLGLHLGFVAPVLASSGDGSPLPAQPPAATASSAADPRLDIGIYDIDKVTTDLGWRDDIEAKLKAFSKRLSDSLKLAEAGYKDQLENEKISLMQNASGSAVQQQQVLSQLSSVMNQALEKLQVEDQQVAQQYRKQLIDAHRDALRPAIGDLARQRHLVIVFEKNESVAYYEESADISQALVDAIKAHPPTVADVPMPDAPAPLMINVKVKNQPTTQP